MSSRLILSTFKGDKEYSSAQRNGKKPGAKAVKSPLTCASKEDNFEIEPSK